MGAIILEVLVVVGTIIVVISLSALMFKIVNERNAVKAKNRQDMLDALKNHADTIKKVQTLTNETRDMKKRIALISHLHVDSDDVPGYCAADDEEWPCKTARLADFKTDPRSVDV